jgi:hypothetical protein
VSPVLAEVDRLTAALARRTAERDAARAALAERCAAAESHLQEAERRGLGWRAAQAEVERLTGLLAVVRESRDLLASVLTETAADRDAARTLLGRCLAHIQMGGAGDGQLARDIRAALPPEVTDG